MSGYGYAAPIFGGYWAAVSGDDGATWSAPEQFGDEYQAQNYPVGDGTAVSHSYFFSGLSVLRTDDNLLLVATEHAQYMTYISSPNFFYNSSTFWSGPPQSGARASLVVLNTAGVGAAQGEDGSVTFRGDAALL